jgi:glycerophosphoryl diester phosphodiesterase
MSTTRRRTLPGRPSTVALGIALAVALLAGACGSGDDTDGESDDAADRGTTTTTTSTVPEPAADTVEGLLALDRPIVLAHAGGENSHPHSTPYAYAESVKAGVDVLDFDVRLTGDGVLVVHHDDDVDRTTDGTGDVSSMTYDQLHALDAAYWWTEECSACRDQPEDAYVLRGIRTGDRPPPAGYEPDDFAVPKFEDVARTYPHHVLNIEIKGSYPDAVPVADELARVLRELDRTDAAVVTAFDDALAEAFHEAAPEVEITPGLQAMAGYALGGAPLPADRRIIQVPPEYEGIEVLTPEFLANTKADGKVLWIWPNDRSWENADGYRRLLDMGVGGINAADPEVAVQVLREATGD